MMRPSPLLIGLGLTFVGCASDYNVRLEEKKPAPGHEDTSEPNETAEPVETAEPEDTGTPQDTSVTEPPGDQPVAVCSVSPNPVHPPFETAQWDGSSSYDPAGGTITNYNWTLASKPSGSSAVMPSGSGPFRNDFLPDLAGDYVGRLVVTTADGRSSEPCETTLEAIPAESLWVEMYWTVANDDMDLHLLAPGGSLLSDRDCYYANCVGGWLDWGTVGDEDDDPALDLDDIPNTGPENINIFDPQNGTFTVYVHDYSGSTPDYYGSNTVTVNIYIAGALVYTGTTGISGDGDYVPFAEVDWPTGAVTDLL